MPCGAFAPKQSDCCCWKDPKHCARYILTSTKIWLYFSVLILRRALFLDQQTFQYVKGMLTSTQQLFDVPGYVLFSVPQCGSHRTQAAIQAVTRYFKVS